MTPQRYQQIQEVFQRVSETPAPQQQEMLDQECTNDPDLRSQVEKLLPYLTKTTGNLLDLTTTAADRQPAPLPANIGPYKILSQIGLGGMGVVYEAEQNNPRRHVALKVLASRNDDPYYTKLFQREVRALARLDDARIARIYDAGRTDEGQYYFAMELIRGCTLSDYAKNNNLSDADRLQLFRTVCDAINSAHQRGVVHLDLKPSNILVDESGSPRILDFGLARIVEVDTTTITIFRDAKHLHGTLPYMSPEQVRGDARTIDVRSDIYSLGVILFELMTGALPIEPKGRSWHMLLRAILDEPPRTPREVRSDIPADVEVIIQKSLEKDRDDRYQSALSLSEDIQRHLTGHPILARPQTALQTVQKWILRHRIASASAAVFLISVTTVAIWMSALYARASTAEHLAEVRLQATTEAHAKAEQKAELHARERDKAERAASFLTEMITLTDPYFGIRGDVPIWRLLDRASQRAAQELGDFPQLEANLRETIGISYSSLGLIEKADAELQRAVELQRTRGPEHLTDLARVLIALGHVRCKDPRLASIAPIAASEAVDIRTTLLGPEHPDTLDAELNLARAHHYARNLDIAKELSAKVLAASRRLYPENDARIATALMVSGNTAHLQGWFDVASEFFDQAASIYERHKNEMPEDYINVLESITSERANLGHYAQAEVIANNALEVASELLGAKHSVVARLLTSLARVQIALDRPTEAGKNLDEAMEIFTAWFPENAPSIRNTKGMIGGTRWASGDYEEAERIFRELATETAPATTIEFDNRFHTLAVVLRDMEKFEEAESILVRINNNAIDRHRADHPYAANGKINLARLYYLKGEYEKAEPLARSAMKIRRNQLGEHHPNHAESCMVLGLVLTGQGDTAAGEPLLRQALAIRQELWGDKHSLVAEAKSSLAQCLIEQKQYAQAETLLVAARSVLSQKLLPQHKYRRLTRQRLARLYKETQRPELAAEYQLVLKTTESDEKP